MNKTNLIPELLVNDSDGIYIPQTFARLYNLPENFINYDEVKDDLELLSRESSPDMDNYFEIWEDVIGKAKMRANDSEYYLYDNGDLWSVPVGYENEEFFEN